MLYVQSIEEAKEKIDSYETTNGSRFCCVRADKDFGRIDPFERPHKVLWQNEDCIPFSGVPFFVVGEKFMECHYGKDRNIGAKIKYQRSSLKNAANSEHRYAKRKKLNTQNSKKLDCPAKLNMKEVVFFPEYKISENTQRKRKHSSSELRNAIAKGVTLLQDHRIYIKFPSKNSHKNHILGEASGIQQLRDPSELQPSCSKVQPDKVKINVAEASDEASEASNVNDDEANNPLPLCKKYHRSEAAQLCRSLLAQLRCATFLVQSTEVLEALGQTLSKVLTEIRAHIYQEDGIEVETLQSKPQKRKNEECHGQKREELGNLPLLPKKNSRRHGMKATEGQEKGHKEEQEKGHEGGKEKGHEEGQEIGHEEGQEKGHEEGQEKGQEGKLEQGQEKEKAAELNDDGMDSGDDDIYIIGVRKGTRQTEKRKKRKMDKLEEKNIASGRMLSDISINITQNLLHDQFPTCQGLEDTTLGNFLQYSICNGEFVQILFTGQQNWVCASNIGCQRGEINIYDSSNHGHVSSHVKKQVAAILHEEGPEITINIKSVQQQQNGTDCGVFSIAFLTSLLHGHDPSTQTYSNDKLREHLLTCILNSYVTPFPEDQGLKVRCKERKLQIQLFCTCRMPWDDMVEETQIISCNTCGKWFYYSCEQIPDIVFQEQSFWQCSVCSY